MKKVIIIGGGFAGSFVARKLEREKFDVTLIDTKDYFEFTPSILRTIVEPEHIKKIQVLHRHYLKKTKIIIGEVREISKNSVKVDSKKLNFDYLVIASGSSYTLPIKEQNLVISTRANHLRDSYNDLCKAKKVLIVGGGLVGVELAAEILDCYNDKEITIVHAGESVIERNHKKAINLADKFLKKRGVNIIFNERVIQNKKGIFVTDKGTKIKPDMAFLCTGITPNFEFMKKNFSYALNKRNQIEVNPYLQIKNNENIFSAGDITSIKEEKTAQNAEKQAKIVVKNICSLEKKKKLYRYESKPNIMVISLGKRNGILTHKNFIIKGLIPAFMKNFIEYKSMRKYKK